VKAENTSTRIPEGGTANERIRGFILDTFPLARKQNVKDRDNLLDSGIIDSLGMLDVVSFLEREFAIHVDDEELVPENFESIDNLAGFVGRKSSAAPSQ
jgi:acyl carrier protein